MDQSHFKSDSIILNEAALRDLFPPTHRLAVLKSMDALDTHARNFIRRSPFVCIGTQNPDGKADVSPRGDPAGFVNILDERTLAIPDRPGNNRLDTLSNIIANPSVGLLFMVPGFDETLRVNGAAYLVTDSELLARMRVGDRAPKLAIVVEVEEAFLHCAKAFRRSRLWDPECRRNRSEMPSLMNMLLDQTTGTPDDKDELQRQDDALEDEYARTMY